MRQFSFILLAISVFLCVDCTSGQHGSGTRSTVPREDVQTGYHGPVALGPFSMNNKEGGVEFDKLLSKLRDPAAPPHLFVCFHDASSGTYLIIERRADNRRLAVGLTLSRFNVCPTGRVHSASGFASWATEKGIRLGSPATDLVSQYGEPSRIDDLRTDSDFYLSPYPLEQKASAVPRDGRTLSYLPKEDAPDTSHALFGVRHGIVVWITVSDNE